MNSAASVPPFDVSEDKDSRLFPPTRWSLVSQSRQSPEVAAKALSELCQIYWYPVYAFVRTLGKSHHDAEDLTQAFFASLLEREDFSKADQQRGRLRSFLCIAVKRFVIGADRKERTIKRGGHHRIVSLDAEADERRFLREPCVRDTPETYFHKRWATTVLEATIRRIKRNYAKRGQSDLLEDMLPYVSLNARDKERQLALAAKNRMSLDAFRMGIARMRQRYHETLRGVVADTVEDPNEIDEELRFLKSVFG